MRMIFYGILFLLASFSIVFTSFTHAVEPALTVDDLIAMASSGKSDDHIIGELQARGIAFETNVAVVQRLVDAGLSPGALQVMLSVSGRNKQQQSHVFAPLSPSIPGLSISTTPPGMDVFINGENQGLTPFFSNKLLPGKYMVRVQHPLFVTQEKTIDFSGEVPVYLNWSMEPGEPIVRFNIALESDSEDYPWSWVIRTKQNCPDPVDVQFESAPQYSLPGNAIFVLNTESKATYQGSGQACFELYLWRGKIRTNLAIKDLPSPVARYLISDVRIKGITYVDLDVKIVVNTLDPLHPVVTMDSSTGYLIDTQDKAPTVPPEELQRRMLETMKSPAQPGQ